jgi:hypothetical protein
MNTQVNTQLAAPLLFDQQLQQLEEFPDYFHVSEWERGPSFISGDPARDVRFHMVMGKSGRRHLYKENLDPNYIFVEGGPDSNGCGGRTLDFSMVDDTIVSLKGPWGSNADYLFEDTGVDLRLRYETQGVIALKSEGKNWNEYVFTNIIYYEKDFCLGSYDRILDLAQEKANELKQTVHFRERSKPFFSTRGYAVEPKSGASEAPWRYVPKAKPEKLPSLKQKRKQRESKKPRKKRVKRAKSIIVENNIIKGDTYQVKEVLKQYRCKYNGSAKHWLIPSTLSESEIVLLKEKCTSILKECVY